MKERSIKAYFNHAGLTRPSGRIIARVRAAEREFGDLLFSESGISAYLAMLAECRAAIAEAMGLVEASGISITINATAAIQLAMSALAATLAPGDFVLTSDQEHPCVTRPLAQLARRGIEVTEVAADSAAEFLDRVAALIARRRPGFAVISQVSYKNGRIIPVEQVGEMLAADQIPYIVDGAQAFGQIPVNVPATRAWAYIFSGHKWIGGPWATGGMWTSAEFDAHNRFTLINCDDGITPATGGRYESGTMSYGTIAGLRDAVREYIADGTSRADTLRRLREEIGGRLEGLYPATRWDGHFAPGILSYLMPPEENSWDLAETTLARHGVAIKPFHPPERPDAIRISFKASTSRTDIDLLERALREVHGRRR